MVSSLSNLQDPFSSLPHELQAIVLDVIRNEDGMKFLFPMRNVSRSWCRLIDDYLYDFFINGPDILYCYVNLWNRFRQKLVQQRCILRLRIRTKKYIPPMAPPRRPAPPNERGEDEVKDGSEGSENSKSDISRHTPLNSTGMASWQPSENPSPTPSLRPPPKDYAAYIYDAVFDPKFEAESDQIRVLDINIRTRRQISLGSGLTKFMEMNHQPPRAGCVFPLFHVIQEAWDFVLAEDVQAMMPLYPPIASEAWIQIRLLMVPAASRWQEPRNLHIQPSQDPFWPFRFNEYITTLADDSTRATGSHQFAVLSRLALPSCIQDEGIALVTVEDTNLEDWIEDQRYRELMQSMMNVADISGPQEFILGGAVCTIEDFERFIPPGMVKWFRRTILDKWTTNASPAEQTEEGEGDERDWGDMHVGMIPVRQTPLSDELVGNVDIGARLLSRFEWAMTVLDEREQEMIADLGRRRRDM